MLPALYIGRFQPFHLGHLDAIQQILAKESSLIIAIGSSTEHGTIRNPFNSKQREEMIVTALKENKITVPQILLVPDINNNELWVKHVENLCPQFGNIYSGTPLVQELFKINGTHSVKDIELNKAISATEIREKMASNLPWESLVPNGVAILLKKWHPSGE